MGRLVCDGIGASGEEVGQFLLLTKVDVCDLSKTLLRLRVRREI